MWAWVPISKQKGHPMVCGVCVCVNLLHDLFALSKSVSLVVQYFFKIVPALVKLFISEKSTLELYTAHHRTKAYKNPFKANNH